MLATLNDAVHKMQILL